MAFCDAVQPPERLKSRLYCFGRILFFFDQVSNTLGKLEETARGVLMSPASATILQMMKLRPDQLDKLGEKHPALVAEAKIQQALSQQQLSGEVAAPERERPQLFTGAA